MAVDVNNQSWSIYSGEDFPVTLTGTDSTNPTGWSMIATVADAPGVIPPEASTTSVTVAGSGPYTLSFSFSRAQTLLWPEGGSPIAWDIWRKDSGYNFRLAGGWVTVLPAARDNET